MRRIESNFDIKKAIIVKISAPKMAPPKKKNSNDEKIRGQNIKIGKILGADFSKNQE